MSVRLFAGYFLMLAACATVALASLGRSVPASPPAEEAALMTLPAPAFAALRDPSFRTHASKAPVRRAQVAAAE